MAVSRSTRKPLAFLTALMVVFALVVPLLGTAFAAHSNPRTRGTGAGVEVINAGPDDTAPANTCNEFAVQAFGDPNDNTPAEGETVVVRATQADADTNQDIRLSFCDPDGSGQATDLSGADPALATGQQTGGGGTPLADCDDNGTGNINDGTATTACPATTPVAGAEAPADIRDVCQTDANGFCRFGVFSNEAGTMTLEVFSEENAPIGDLTRQGNDPFDTVVKTWTAGSGAARNISCVPTTDRNPEGTRHEFQCTVTDANGQAVPGATVSYDVTAGPNSEEVGRTNCGNAPTPGDTTGTASPAGSTTSGSGTTPAPAPEQSTGGQPVGNSARCGYDDTTNADPYSAANTSFPGTDTIQAWVNLPQQPGGTVPTSGPDTGEPSTQITKTWVGPGRNLDCEPETATNAIGTAHVVTCTLTDRANNPVQGVEIDFTESGPGTIGDTGPFVTNASGQVTVTIDNNQIGSTGTQTITGFVENAPVSGGVITTRTNQSRTECSRLAGDPAGSSAGVCSDSVQKTWTPSQGEEDPQCNDGVDNDGDGRIDYPSDPDCAGLEDNSEAHQPVTREVATNLTIRYDADDNAFKGAAGSSRKGCQVGRQVTLKRSRPGRDAVVGRDTTNRQGNWSIAKNVSSGRYYAVVKRKVFTAANGDTIKCLRDRSVTIKV